MHYAVYLPLILSMVAAVAARWPASRLEPHLATWLLTATAVALAALSGIALALLTSTLIGQIPPLAHVGRWSAQILRQDNPASLTAALVAGTLLTAALAASARVLLLRARAILDAARMARDLSTAHDVVVVDDHAPDAFAVPGMPGRIVVSSGMLAALDPRETQALFAHERAHLTGHHHLFVGLTDLAAAANPLLRPLAGAVRYTTERWADEDAAAVVGDRRLVARTIGKAAIVTRHHDRPAAALALTGRGPRRAGPVPRRVSALLAPPPNQRRMLPALAIGLLAIAASATFEATRDLHALFELASLP
ncbi:M56 family metallopeptidase [Rhodococcus sp. NPDC056960]|uniref:M56 family metallopeptidase n=1 Tax=Rhodococcus sp. NPDC056960 TaxID=3345982 RepID=UPI003632EF75